MILQVRMLGWGLQPPKGGLGCGLWQEQHVFQVLGLQLVLRAFRTGWTGLLGWGTYIGSWA